MKVALVYDRVNKWGGAERVLLALHKMFPDAPLFTSVYNKSTAKWADSFDVKTSFLQNVKFFREHNELLAVLMPVAFESFNFDEFNLVISVTSESAKGIVTKPGTTHICYCLTPTRYLWSGYDTYFNSNLSRLVSRPGISYLKRWDKIAASRPDYYISISNEVRNRVKKYYGLESEIIYPPLFINDFKKVDKINEKYFLLVSRLSRFANYKKVDLVIDAFNKNGLSLKIAGTGSKVGELESKSKKNIEFLGEVSDERLVSLYRNAKALIFPAYEDFGLVMAESISYGTPVIAFKAGGALDIVKEGVTGTFFDEQNSGSLISALQNFDESRYNKSDIVEYSKKFSYESFSKNFNDFIIKNHNL